MTKSTATAQKPNMTFTTAEIAKHLDGEVVGDAAATLKGFAHADHAKPGDLTFAENEDYFARAEQSAATAIIADERFKSAKKILIRVPNARVAFGKAMALFFRNAPGPPEFIPRPSSRRARRWTPLRTSGRIVSSASA